MSFEKIELIIPKRLLNLSNFCLNKQAAFAQWSSSKKLNEEIILRLRPSIFRAILPVKITLTRIASREFDKDNLIHAFKHIKDTISKLFYPSLPIGQADDFECFEWAYKQEKGAPKKYAIKIEIEGKPGIPLDMDMIKHLIVTNYVNQYCPLKLE